MQHFLYAPMWMQRQQTVGTAGKDVQHSHTDGTMAHAAHTINAAKAVYARAGKALDYEVVRAWFAHRYAAWQADHLMAISVEDVVTFITQTKNAWVEAA